MTAQWQSNCNDGLSSVGSYKNFDYTGSVQTFNACAGRTYKLEVWGAQGGKNGYSASDSNYDRAAYGGYAYGEYVAGSQLTLYVFVGGQGTGPYRTNNTSIGGWNGGEGCGDGTSYGCGTGGGSTDIRTINAAVVYHNNRTYSTTDNNSLNSRLIVAGGGGGGSGAWGQGGDGGGFRGSGCPDYPSNNVIATQTSGGAFGYGLHSATSGYWGGAGGGWYGGGDCNGGTGGGSGGSGYIGSSLLTNKGMYMYSTDCTSSTATSTKTTCTTSTGTHVANAANTGNGYAKITYLGT